MTIAITLQDIPPSANNLHMHFVKNGKVRRAKTKKYAAWRDKAMWELRSQTAVKIKGPYKLEISVPRDWRSKRARDIDNMIKPVSDALVKSGIVKDDSLAESVFAQWEDGLTGIWIKVEEA